MTLTHLIFGKPLSLTRSLSRSVRPNSQPAALLFAQNFAGANVELALSDSLFRA